MAFGGGGGFAGFGSNNNNQQGSSGFGGFGASSSTGFGQQQNTGFGSSQTGTGGNLFGSGGGGFGASSSTPFGGANKPAFGASTTSSGGGGGLFGNNTATSGSTGFGGFGSNTNAGSGFGGTSTNTGGGLFGANKSFGTGSTGSSLFGGNNATSTASTGFGAGGNTGGGLFGAAQGTALGANTNECQGTGSTPFQAWTEKEANSAITNHYQSITFMQPYQKFSFEELRLADYNAGRKYGNGSGQAGAFGASTGFGGFGQTSQSSGTGFGNTGNTLFGQTTSSTSPFGNNTQTAGGGFGSTGGALFGPKPAATGLFGNAQASSSQPSGGLFASSGAAGFGAQQIAGFGGGNTGGGLFGTNSSQQKTGFSFGSQNAPNSNSAFGNTGGFGAANNSTSTPSLFGNNQTQSQGQTSSLFGGPQQNQTSNAFGSANQNQNQAGPFGGFNNNNQQKPSLFGTSNASNNPGGSLFGPNQNNQQQSNTGLFGNSGPNNSVGSFNNKPATLGGGLFPPSITNANSNTTGGGGIFGNLGNQGQQSQNTSLFGNNNQQQNKPSLFGPTSSGTGLFGGAQPQNQNNSSLFGNQNNNQNQGTSLFGNNANSLFNGSQQNPLQPPQAMTASINDATPYGSSSIFSGLPPPPQSSPGPIATPISIGQKQKKPAALPQYKINPAMTSRLVTPQKRGYGFSYSTYGTPSSATSVASTPGGLSNSLLGGSIGRNLGKSFSTSNLRRTFDTDGDSILSPGAFSASSTRYSGTGSLKRLNIDRTLRTDLFGNSAVAALPVPERNDASRSPSILKKKVSFDATTVGGNGNGSNTNGNVNGVANQENSNPTAQEQGFLRSHSYGRGNGSRSSNGQALSEMEQVKGNELAIVPEDESPEAGRIAKPVTRDQNDPEPGEYWIRPSLSELKKMSRDQLKHVSGVQVGRERCGYVSFDQSVDLTTVDLDAIFDNIAVITVRSITIYPHDVRKPPVGMGLNVPSTLLLENSWPRQRDKKTPSYEKVGPRFDKHVKRLSSVKGTEFVRYDADTGDWTFRVPHFTTYGLDYDDEENDLSQIDMLQSSILSDAPSTPTPKSHTPKARTTPLAPRTNEADSSVLTLASTQASSEPEDTFGYKRRNLFPGSFDDDVPPLFEDEQEMEEVQQNGKSFLGERSAVAHSEDEEEHDEPSEYRTSVMEDHSLVVMDEADEAVDGGMQMEMAGSYPAPNGTNEVFPKSILKSSQQLPYLGTPRKLLVDLADDWTEQLQRTISPKKQDREALRQSQARLFRDSNDDTENFNNFAAKKANEGEIATSIDLMNSLFGKEEERKSGRGLKLPTARKGFQWPYPKTVSNHNTDMSDVDRNFHDSFKPAWGPGNLLLYVTQANDKLTKRPNRSFPTSSRPGGIGGSRDIRFSRFVRSKDITTANFQKQQDRARITLEDGVPFVTSSKVPFDINNKYPDVVPVNSRETLIWELASILFDNYDDDISEGIPDDKRTQFEDRIRKDRLATFWADLCQEQATAAVASARTAEERAIAYLSMNKVLEACTALVDGKNYRLATLVAQIGGDKIIHDEMRAQIEDWRKLNVLSEISDPVRCIYELLAGNTFTSIGKKGAVEDRANTFIISERFSLDWKRAFGLKLWYAILDDSPLEDAVNKFALDFQEEAKQPMPWFLEDGHGPLPFKDPHADERVDVLWGVLSLYANRSCEKPTKLLAEAVMPENVTGNPLQNRLSFELYQELAPRFPNHVSAESADRLTLAFVDELSSAKSWLWCLFVLMRLTNPQQRQRALQSTLALYAPLIDTSDTDLLRKLFQEFLIPESWLWQAKALQARAYSQYSSTNNPEATGADNSHTTEIRFLLRARSWDEAHRALCTTVAPFAIVERDYTVLRELLDGFDMNALPSNWQTGGQLYEDYLRLVGDEFTDEDEKSTLLRRLLRTLADFGAEDAMLMGTTGDRSGSKKKKKKSKIQWESKEDNGAAFLHRVAVQEMSAVVGDAVLRDSDDAKDKAWVLQLPLTSETKRIRAAELSWDYYRKVMAMGG